MEKKQITASDDLYRAVLGLENIEQCRAFFEDLCTIRELQDLSQRFEVAKMLWEGKNYQEVSAATGASTATICRVNRCLNYGADGYRFVFDKKGEGSETK